MATDKDGMLGFQALMTWGSAADGLVCASTKLVLPSENRPDDELVGFEAG
jgi:hypothetical protein